MKLTREEKIAILSKRSKPVNSDAKWKEIAKWNAEHTDALEDYVIIAMRISSVLKERKMTQRKLAELLEVKPQALTRIMKGRQNLTLNKIRQIERILDISLIQIKKVKESNTSLRTVMVPVEIHYNLSKSALDVGLSILKTTSNKREQKKYFSDLTIAS